LCWKWSEETVLWQVLTLIGHSETVWSIAFSPDGNLIVSGSNDKLVKIWDVKTGTEVSKLVQEVRSHATVSRVLWVRRVLMESVNWQVRTLTGHSGKVYSAAFSPGGQSIVSGSEDKLVKIWDVETGAVVSIFVGVVVRLMEGVSARLESTLRGGWVGR
jgi:WD40 repeat protein